ncbi:MAG TPA: PEP-utilizing enzyme, partial [Candidatus Absconditabacterales bacterium]|nr:PEP-utilizing enzyme [Candidatus Absconditabacterales bacterium]
SSHAAVVARGWGKTCVVGTSDISIDYTNLLFTTENGVCVKEGEWIGINGTTGQVLLGIHEVIPAERTLELERFMSWAKKFNQYAIRANVDTPEDAILARQYGAVGIGLVRAEHMFFKSDERVADICSLILFRKDKELFGKALEKIAVYQLEDYYGILKAMDGLPVNCRLFDAPLAEFKPKKPNVITMIAEFAGVSVDVVEKLSAAMHENNSMMGMRSCHFLELFPEMTKMEAKAIIGAAVKLKKEGYDPQPEIMIPLTIKAEEIVRQKALIDQVAETIFAEEGIRIEYKVGTMIETPGACIDSDKIALPADYFCFGTNDLTQLTLGISRDDNGPFISHYVAKIFAGEDPFETLDPSVKELMRLSVQKGKNTKSTLKVGICGEHGGDPRSIIFCLQELGMHYVSPSTNRVETAILVAARLSFLLPQH